MISLMIKNIMNPSHKQAKIYNFNQGQSKITLNIKFDKYRIKIRTKLKKI